MGVIDAVRGGHWVGERGGDGRSAFRHRNTVSAPRLDGVAHEGIKRGPGEDDGCVGGHEGGVLLALDLDLSVAQNGEGRAAGAGLACACWIVARKEKIRQLNDRALRTAPVNKAFDHAVRLSVPKKNDLFVVFMCRL